MKNKALARRWLERGKTLLIAALTVSALVLLYLSPLVQGSGLSSILPAGSTGTGSVSSSTAAMTAAIPARMAVGTELGRYGVQYDQAAADALFDTAGPLLGEALSAAGEPSALSESQWRALLAGQCVYFDFDCPVPLSALCAWLKDGAENEVLDGYARLLLLAPAEDGTLSLCYQESGSGGYFRCATTLNAALHLDPITESVTPNSAFFAFEDDTLPEILSPLTLFTNEEINAPVYRSSTPVSAAGGDGLALLLSALSFDSQNQATAGSGTLYVDGYDTLRLSNDGQEVSYSASGTGKYPAGEGLTGAVSAAWTLADAALGSLCGDARLYLMSVQADGDGDSYTITFGYALNGCAVYLYDQGWAAQFQVQDGYISQFVLHPRAYVSSGQQTLLLPPEKAAAALTALTDTTLELVIQYRDAGGESVEPGWVGR